MQGPRRKKGSVAAAGVLLIKQDKKTKTHTSVYTLHLFVFSDESFCEAEESPFDDACRPSPAHHVDEGKRLERTTSRY